MIHSILFALWLFLPAAFANATPVFIAKLPLLRDWTAPIDGGRKFRGQPLLGSHKTWRGLICGMVVATLTFWLQQIAVAHFDWAHTITSSVDYAQLPVFIFGPLLGVGALGGDAIESFFKRQRGTKSGQSWVPFDQLDYIIGGIIVSLPFMILPLVQYAWILVVWFCLHIAATTIGYKLGLKDQAI